MKSVIEKRLAGLIGGGVAAVAVFLFVISSGLFRAPADQGEEFVMKDLEIKLKSVAVVSTAENDTAVEVIFDTYNPNRMSVVLEAVQYSLYAEGIEVAISVIGERPEGFVTGSGKTFTMYSEYSMTLKDNVRILRSDLNQSIWKEMQEDRVQWRTTGTVFATDPVRQGGREINFDFIE